LELRNPADHALIRKLTLGPMSYPRVAFSKTTGQAAILYTKPSGTGTFVRWIEADP
jgi:hypothetical protein